MLEVKLNFRDTDAGEYPEKSMQVMAVRVWADGCMISVANLDYSHRHKAFNSFDGYTKKQAEKYAIKSVRYWLPMEEFEAAIHAAWGGLNEHET